MQQPLFWNLDTGVVNPQRYSPNLAQVQAERGGVTVPVILMRGSPPLPVQLDAGVPVGIVIRDPGNLKAGCLAGPTVLAPGANALAGYSGDTSTDTTLTRTLMHVGPTDLTPEMTSFSALAAFYYVPAGGGEPVESLPFAWTILSNYYRPGDPPADVVENYPPAATLQTIAAAYAGGTLGGVNPHPVADNQTKLAQTGISSGWTNVITTEGNRTEMYLPVEVGPTTDGVRMSFDGVNFVGCSRQFDGSFGSLDDVNFIKDPDINLFVISDAGTNIFTAQNVCQYPWQVTGWDSDDNLSQPIVTQSSVANENNWFALRNTIRLTVYNSGEVAVINKHSIPNNNLPYSAGWAYEDAIPYAASDGDDIYLEQIQSRDASQTTNTNLYLTGSGSFALPIPAAKGASLILVITD